MQKSFPSEAKWFTDSRFGLFVHWGIYSLAARGEWVQNHEKIPTEQYRKYFQIFDPDQYNPEKWAKIAKKAGMKYCVLTTKHHDGFCLWDTKHTSFKSTNTPAGRDLIKPFVDAFRAEGLKIGFYYSLLDWNHPDFPIDYLHPKYTGERVTKERNSNGDMEKYALYMQNQVRELLTQYGIIDLFWFDFSYPQNQGKGRKEWKSEKLVSLVKGLQPQILINDRLDLPGSEDFVSPEQLQPQKVFKDSNGNTKVWELCHTFGKSWGYTRNEPGWKKASEVIKLLVDTVSKGGNLLFNVGPTARGEFEPRAEARLLEIGEWMRLNGRAIYGCGAASENFTPPPRLSLHL